MVKGSNIVCHTYCGAIDLFYDVPDLKGSTVVDVEHGDEKEKATRLVFKKADGEEFSMTILPAH